MIYLVLFTCVCCTAEGVPKNDRLPAWHGSAHAHIKRSNHAQAERHSTVMAELQISFKFIIIAFPVMISAFALGRALRSVCQCRNMSVTWVWQIASALERSQEWTREVVKEVLTSAKQARWPLLDLNCYMPLSASLCISSLVATGRLTEPHDCIRSA